MQNVVFVDQAGQAISPPVLIDVPRANDIVFVNGQRFSVSAVAFFVNTATPAATRAAVALVPIVTEDALQRQL